MTRKCFSEFKKYDYLIMRNLSLWINTAIQILIAYFSLFSPRIFVFLSVNFTHHYLHPLHVIPRMLSHITRKSSIQIASILIYLQIYKSLHKSLVNFFPCTIRPFSCCAFDSMQPHNFGDDGHACAVIDLDRDNWRIFSRNAMNSCQW